MQAGEQRDLGLWVPTLSSPNECGAVVGNALALGGLPSGQCCVVRRKEASGVMKKVKAREGGSCCAGSK